MGRALIGKGRRSRSLLADRHCNQLVALPNCIDCFLPLSNLAEHGVFAVQPIGRDVGNEKLAAVCVRAGVRHGQTADLMFARIVFYFVFESITRAAATGPSRVTALDHEVSEYPMKHRTVVKLFAGEKNEVVNRFRSVLREEIAHDFSPRCLERGGVMLVLINHHRWRSGILFVHDLVT